MSNHRAIIGPAGSGKTTLVKNTMPAGTVLTSTTGISARQLGNDARTVHSVLHFHSKETFDTRSPQAAWNARSERFLIW